MSGYRIVHRPSVVYRPCACDGVIGILESDLVSRHAKRTIQAALIRHSRLEIHRRWTDAGMPGLESDAPVDVHIAEGGTLYGV